MCALDTLASVDWIGRALPVIILFIQFSIAISLLYHYALLVVAIRTRPGSQRPAAQNVFAFVIPAHNEEAVIGATLDTLASQTYPRALWRAYVIADHCADRTAEAARNHGAVCLERTHGLRGRKGYALQWGLEQVLERDGSFDAIVVLDADSKLDARFLESMNAELTDREMILQGQHIVIISPGGRFAGLADVDMRLNNLLRNKAKRNLGLSGRLMGDAMCFPKELIETYGWPADSLTEDREYGLQLLLAGVRTVYVPQAVSYGQAVSGWKDATTQRLRWFSGVSQVRQRMGLKLLVSAVQRLDLRLLDQFLELVLPSISYSTLLSTAIALIHLLTPRMRWLVPKQVSFAIALMWVLFPWLCLWVARAPASSFRALIYGPLYMVWRVALGFAVRVRLVHAQWVRTRRQEEIAAAQLHGPLSGHGSSGKAPQR